ncbi:hypothetical protein Rt10032_c13g5128 [Rhodotorula toruloides]|uniref:Proteophosphoglycan ppg4 n=1 Tax=Rhodotorula toruloides TaxID=5286 RepID=A0A511KL72_RHOTO|nr:hypothetical protein Rt10032_c13g5128 [Rhodotorula toruloides]
MRATSLVLVSLASASSLVAAKPAEGGSIEALLDRVAQRSNRTVSAKPSETPAVAQDDAKKDPAVEKADLSVEEDDGPRNKLVRRSRAQKHQKMAKKWVWATGIIQDGATNAPPVGSNVNLLTPSTTIATDTPTATLVAPSFPPVSTVNLSSTIAPAVANATASTTSAPVASQTTGLLSKVRLTFKQREQALIGRDFDDDENEDVDEEFEDAEANDNDEHQEKKRWVWATEIIQDGATNLPPAGQNANLLTPSTTIVVQTPGVTLVPPTFAPPAWTTPAASQSANVLVAPVAVNSSSTTTSAPKTSMTPVARKFGHKAVGRALHGQQENRRWVWATSIIQDGATDAPPVGQNANLLSSSAYPVTTPAAALTPPSFPPVAAPSSSSSSSTTAPAPSSTSVPAPAIAVAAASTTLGAPAAASTTSAPHGLAAFNPKHIFEEIESGFEKLFHIHHSTTTAAPVQSTSAAPNAKRWVWATSIIQNGDLNAPPVGSNYNLLSGTVAADTPAATLVPPSFQPVQAPSSTTSPAASKTPVLAALPALQSSASHSPVHRVLFKDRHPASASSPAHVVAAANAAVTRSMLSAATKPTTAAQQWYRADPKRRGMARARRA